MNTTATRERWPKDPLQWQRFALVYRDPQWISSSAWRSRSVCVVSSLQEAEAPDGRGDVILQWLVTISDSGKRPGPKHVRRALRAFGMLGADLDNHHPGNAQHFWMPVDPARRVACECKTDETLIRDPDGYAWTNPVDGPCRGCEIAPIVGRPCPIHGDAA
jgi:hypothetical protein